MKQSVTDIYEIKKKGTQTLISVANLRWDTVNTETKISSAEKPELVQFPF